MDEHKMSKSLGNVIDPFQIIEKFGTDALRFYLMREVSFGQDGNVSTEGFENRYTTELANEYGNLASRTLAMIERYRDGEVTRPPDATGMPGIADRVCALLDRIDITGALDVIWQEVRALNAFVAAQEPWKMAKDPDRAADLDGVLYTLAEGLRVLSVLLHPWIPDATGKLLTALGEESRAMPTFGDWAGGKVSKIDPLFPRVE
jgi:methionyl-tRNA synthetase